ncbi:MAG: glycosyl hydrolase family 32, partial [Burkholderiales bacterium PBB5]
PTAPWRSAMTLPRELVLRQAGGQTWVASQPARELLALQQPATLDRANLTMAHGQALDLSAALAGTGGRLVLNLSTAALRGFTLTFGNDAGEALQLGYDAATAQWWIDRRHSGRVDFHASFAGRHHAPRLANVPAADLQLWFDATSVELFADGGLSTMTSLFFPQRPWTRLSLVAPDGITLDALRLQPLRDPR